jgi:hypothetical protein
MLHPGVGGQDEERGHDAAQADDADGQRVDQRRQPVPAEDPQPDERGLDEEREQPFHGQRRAEDVAHEHRVVRPVHAELEFLHDAGDDAHREIDQEQHAEEPGQLLPLLILGAVGEDLHHRDEKCQPDGQRDEQEMVGNRDTELPPGQEHFRPGHSRISCSTQGDSSPASTIQGSGRWQLPQRGMPRAAAGTRFRRPQCGQVTS